MTTRRPPDPLPTPVTTRVRLFGYSFAGALLFSFLPLPWGMAGCVFAVAALVLGVIAMVAMRRERSTLLWAFVIVGFFMAGSLTLNYGVAAILYSEILEYQDCTSSAITIGAEDRCFRQFEEARLERLKELGVPVSWLDEPEP